MPQTHRESIEVDAPDIEAARDRADGRHSGPLGRLDSWSWNSSRRGLRTRHSVDSQRRTMMKEIKAYIRRNEVNEVVENLQRAGAPGVSVIEMHPVGYGYEANPFQPHGTRLVDRYRYLTIVKLEIMCNDAQIDLFLDVIRRSSSTGNPGDGMIFVSEIV